MGKVKIDFYFFLIHPYYVKLSNTEMSALTT
jgi:hypothetical protein